MALAQRSFATYDEYVYEQGGKSRWMRDKLLAHLPKNIESFTRTFEFAKPYLKSGSILCLGARTGAESLGAVAAGFDGSVGIDLHPVGPTVRLGDWHNLEFPDASFDNVYCNSLDHCLYLDRMAEEVRRVLVPGGRFYVMATNREGATAESWISKLSNEALYWDTSDQLSEAICSYGFQALRVWRTGKWGHYVMGLR